MSASALAGSSHASPATQPTRQTTTGTPRTAAEKLLSGLDATHERRGLTLGSLKQLFGHAGPKADHIADKNTLKALTGGDALPGAPAARSASGGPSLHHVVTVGGVSVSAGDTQSVAAGVEHSYEKETGIDLLQRGQTRQRRYFHFGAKVQDACPNPSTQVSYYGYVTADVKAEGLVTTVERSGHWQLTTDVHVDFTTELIGNVDAGAHYAGLASRKEGEDVTVTRTRHARNLKTGKTYREEPAQVTFEVQSYNPVSLDTFSEFVKHIDDSPADSIRSDRMLNPQAFEDVAKPFVELAAQKTSALFKTVEAVWRKPNECVEIKFDGRNRLSVGETSEVSFLAKSKRGYPDTALVGYRNHATDSMRIYPPPGGKLQVDWTQSPPDGRAIIDLTASQYWPDSSPQNLDIEYVWKAGIAKLTQPFYTEEPVLHFKIAAPNLTTNASGSPGIDPCSVGSLSTKVWRTLSSSPANSPDSELTLSVVNGVRYVSGSLVGSVSTTYQDRVQSCQFTSTGIESCAYTAPMQTVPATVELDIPSQPWGPSIKGYWYVPPAEIGVASGSYPTNCLFPYLLFTLPTSEEVASIPSSQLTDGVAHQISFSGSKHFTHDEGGGLTTVLDYQWSLGLTVTRLNPTGSRSR